MFFKRKIEDHVAEKVATKVFENFKEKKPKKLKTPAKRSMIRDILENTDDYELVARKEGEEFVIRVRKPYMTVSTISQDYVNKGQSFFIHKDGTIDNFWNQVEENKKGDAL